MKNAKKFDPFKNLVLDEYEKDIEEALEREEYVSVENPEQITKMLDEATKNYPELDDSKSITLRVKKKNLIRIKAEASRKHIPYQTLINLLINSYTQGKYPLAI